MKKSILAVPVAIALLSFGVCTQSIANPLENSTNTVSGDQKATVETEAEKGGVAASEQSIAVGDVDVDLSKEIDINKSKEGDAEVENGDYNAVANFGATATVDKSITVKDVRIAVIKSDVHGAVHDNELSFGNGLEQKSYGNDAEAGNSSAQASENYQEAEAEQYNKSFQKLEQEQELKSEQEIEQFQKQKSEQEIKQIQPTKDVAVSKAETEAEAEVEGGGEAEVEKVKTESELKAKQGKDTNVALAKEKSKQDQDQEAENDSEQKAKAKAANKSDQFNKAKVANKADLSNTNTQTAVADAGSYTSAQTQTVYLSTGNNHMDGSSMNGVNAVAQNSGVQSFNQISQNVQANIY